MTKFPIYVSVFSALGILVFILQLNNAPSFSPAMWSTIFFLIIAIILLNHYMIYLPPKGSAISMDSAIFLATMFIFGIELTLVVLFWYSLIFALYFKKIVWWKHLFNFSMYTALITAAYYTFIFTGGVIGTIDPFQVHLYIITLLSYFSLNILIVGLFFSLNGTGRFKSIIIGMVKETISSYLSTLVLSIILGILLLSHPHFGLFLFTTVVVLLSSVFKQYFILYEEVSKKANVDEQTGLHNHSYFKEVLDDYLVNKKIEPLSLAFIDIDDFKKYNDKYGHIAGDELLKFFGKLLKERCQTDNLFAARYGGEEFAIIFPGKSGRETFRYMNKLRKELNDTYFKGVEILPFGCLSFSCGVVEYDEDVYNSTEFIGMADRAMYRAKMDGKNMVHLYDESDIESTMSDYEAEIDHLEQQVRFFLYKDVYTYQHSKRVFQYAKLFANELNLSKHENKLLILGALIHDIGKIEIPREIINKKGKLDAYEWELVKKHVTWGKEIIQANKSLEGLIPLVELHHERYDGKGYPHGMAGEDIPKLARILCIIDSFDAMTTERPYQQTKTFPQAVEELYRCSGTQFDPVFIPPFIAMIEKHYPDLMLEQIGDTSQREAAAASCNNSI